MEKDPEKSGAFRAQRAVLVARREARDQEQWLKARCPIVWLAVIHVRDFLRKQAE
jgi:hypothetical protein